MGPFGCLPRNSCDCWRPAGRPRRAGRIEAARCCQPAVASYVGTDPAAEHLAWSITVLTLRGEHIAEITSFLGAYHFAPFGLPASLP